MNYIRNIFICILSFALAIAIAPLYAQNTEATEIPRDNLNSEAGTAYEHGEFYFSYIPAPLPSGVSFLSLGYEYAYNNTALNLDFLNLGIQRGYYLRSRFGLLFYSLFELSIGHTFTYPFQSNRYDLLQYVVSFGLALYPENTRIRNNVYFGQMSHHYNADGERQAFTNLQNEFGLTYVLFNLADIFRMDFDAEFTYDYVIEAQKSLYHVYLGFVFVQNHSWGELAIRPLFMYSGAIGDNTTIKTQRNFLDATTMSVFGDVPFYSIAEAALLEYRFYFMRLGRKSHKWYEDFYLSATLNIAFLQEDPSNFAQTNTKLYFGGGVGFNIFGSIPISIQFILDEQLNPGFSIFTSILPAY